MFSTQKSRKILLITTILLLSSAGQPAFAFACTANPDNTSQECAETCAWAAAGGPLAYAPAFNV